MDKIKVLATFMKKYSFWFLLGGASLLMLGGWWLATASLGTEFKQRKTKIDGEFGSVNKILDTPDHPNQQTINEVENKHKELKETVLLAWEALYKEQKANNVWPKMLGEGFLKMIRELKPGEEIPSEYRELYWNRIKEYFPKLFEIIDYRHFKAAPSGEARGAEEGKRMPGPTNHPRSGLRDSMQGAGYGGFAAGGENAGGEMVGVVDWDESDINRLINKFDWETRPSTKRVLLAQEDLWVIISLLNVIHITNGNEKEHLRAAIKKIEALQIGADAIDAWRIADGAVFQAAAAGGPLGVGGAEGRGMMGIGMMAGRPSSGLSSPLLGGSGAGSTDPDQGLMYNRYVDEKGTPLAPDAAQPNAEFKMMPVCLRLYMDQRSITKLLVDCANSAMPIDVKRVRLDPGKGQAISLGGGTGVGQGMMAGVGAGYPRGPGRFGVPGGYPPHYVPGVRPPMGEGPATAGGTSSEPVEPGSLDLTVEIQGIIYIYNRPDLEKLGTGAAREQAAGSAPAPAEADHAALPAAATPPGAPTSTPAESETK
jgi:hypothetical protein